MSAAKNVSVGNVVRFGAPSARANTPVQVSPGLASAPTVARSSQSYFEEVRALREKLVRDGYSYVPIGNGGKHPVEREWPEKARLTKLPVTVESVDQHAMATGVATHGLRAVDIDVDGADRASEIRLIALMLLGDAPLRYRENSNHILLLYRATEGEPPKRYIVSRSFGPPGKRERVEVLGRGQQLVAYGSHPSGAEYRWSADAPLASKDKLPTITENQVREFLEVAARVIDAPLPGATRSRPTDYEVSTDIAPETLAAPNAEILLDALNKGRNPGSLDRDKWFLLSVAFAAATRTAIALDRAPPELRHEVCDAWIGWTTRWEGGAAGDTEEDLRTKFQEDLWERMNYGLGWQYILKQSEVLGIPELRAASAMHGEFDVEVAPPPDAPLNAPSKLNPVDDFNRQYAFVAEGASGKIVRFRKDGDIDFVGVRALENLIAHRKISILDAAGNEKSVPLFRAWMESPKARKLDGITFAPGKSDEETAPYLNLWRGLGVVPAPGSWARMDNHLMEILAGGDGGRYVYVRAWLAWNLQNFGNLDKKLPTTLVIRGDHGAGKSIVFEEYAKIYGRHGVILSKPNQIIGQFNAVLGEAIFVCLEEAIFGKDPRTKGPLKHLLTGKALELERKGIDAKQVPNYSHFAIISNERDPIPMESTERRFYVLEASNARVGDTKYFDAISEEMRNGGVEAMAWDLLRWTPPGGDWSFLRAVPRTYEGDMMIARGLDPIEKCILRFAFEGMADVCGHEVRLNKTSTTKLTVSRIKEIFEGYLESEEPNYHRRNAAETDSASIGMAVTKMLPDLESCKSNGTKGRVFPCQPELLKMLKRHKNRGYSAYLDMLQAAEGQEQ